MNREAWQYQLHSQLYGSPYSGCRCFSGWTRPVCPKAPGASWPPSYNAPGALLCVDRVSRHHPGPQNVQRVHFRGSRPVPMWVLGPGGDPIKPMPNAWTQKVGVPPYNLHALTFPSTSGPWSVGIAKGIVTSEGADIVSGAMGQFSLHNSGWS